MDKITKEVVIDISTMGVEDIKALKKEYEQLGNELRKVQAELRNNRKEELDSIKNGKDLSTVQEKLNTNLEQENRLRGQRNQIMQAFKDNAKQEAVIQNAIMSTKKAYEALIGSIEAYNNIQNAGVTDQLQVINKIEAYKKSLKGIASIMGDTQLSNQRLNILMQELGSTMTNASSQIQGFSAQMDAATDSELELAKTTDLTVMQLDEIRRIYVQLQTAVNLYTKELDVLGAEYNANMQDEIKQKQLSEQILDVQERLFVSKERLKTVTGAYTEKLGEYNESQGVTFERQRYLRNATLQFNQVLREMPNFAIDARIGILSLSNNLPYLADTFNEARNAAKKAGESFSFGSVLKDVFKPANLLSLSAIGLTTAFTLLSNPKVWAWVESLFKGKDYSLKTIPVINELSSVVNVLNESFKSGGGEYSNAIEKFYKVSAVLSSATKGYLSAKSAVEYYNRELGDTAGKQKSVNGAIERMKEIKVGYIQSMKDMAIANALFAAAGKSAAEEVRLSFASNAELVGENAQSYIKDITEAQAKLKKGVKREFVTGVTDVGTPLYGRLSDAEYNKQMEMLQKNYDDAVKRYNTAAKTQRDKLIANEQKEQQIYIKKATDYIELSFKNAKKYGLNVLDEGSKAATKTLELVSDSYEKIRKITEENKDLFKTQVGEYTPPAPLKSSYETNELNRQNELESRQKFFLQSYTQQIQNNLDLEKARLKDLQNEKDVFEKHKKERLDYYNSQKTIINESVTKEKENYQTLLKQLNEYETQKIAIEKELSEQEEAYKKASEKGDNAEITRINTRRTKLVADLEIVDKNIASKEEAIKTSERSSKALEKEADDLTKVTKDIEDTGEQIIDTENKIAESGFKIAKLTKDNVRSFAEDMKDVADKLGSLFGDIAGLYQANMDRTNSYYDEKAALIEGDIKNESQRNVALKKNEEERYKALEKDFENQKQWKKAQAWMDFASGTIGIWTAPGITSLAPLGYILAAAQTAALLATTLSNIKTIDAQKLKSPSAASSSSSGGGGSSAVAMLPQKAALTSNEENLNLIGRGMQDVKKGVSVVKVTDINNVQNDVKVRETNSSY